MAGDKKLPQPALEQEMCTAGRPKTKTQFINYSLKELKQMLEGTDPGAIDEVSRHWGKVNEILAGGEDGGIASVLDKAVDNVLEHWEGDAASSFEKKAREIAQSIRNAAWYADLNRSQMADAAHQLRTYKTQLDDIKEPGTMSKIGDALSDWQWDDGQAVAGDLRDGKLTAAQIAEKDEGKIGASREAQLKGVAVMENLGAQYSRITGNFTRNTIVQDPDKTIKNPNPNVEYPPPVTPGVVGASRPSASGSASKPWSAGPTTNVKPAPTVPRDPGISGGTQLPTTKTSLPTTGTNVDSIPSGMPGSGSGMGTGGPGTGGNFGAGGAPSSGAVTPGGTAGVSGGLGFAGGRSGMSGAGAAGRAAGGRAGMGGMGGGGLGAAGRGGASASGRGALARARGGVVGAAKGVGKGAGGGAGLHGSRGGTQAGAGGAGGKGRKSKKENSQGDRPDYLVEDEETWISEEDRNRNIPRTIE
ncbi:WXG100 family type VII secretion target [Streptomyces sp. NPDC001260]|uniref:WXG100 family type VII secretion target n=1 Tax=Streptomyces sp. NPDC001260 TaxID=3364551 RepID=UPI003673FC43